MDYTVESINKIVEYKTWSNKKKLDKLLFMDCRLYTNLGTDSTSKEKEEVRKISRRIYNAIKKVRVEKLRRSKIKNVVVIMLESTRARSVAPYVDTEVTPFFKELA